jgi:hypothetical protein
VAAEQAVRILEVVQALAGGLVAAVGDEAVGLQQAGRADELVRVPPEARAAGGAAGAQDALVQAVELVALLGRLQALLLGRRASSLTRYGLMLWYCLKNCVMSTIRSRITGSPGSGLSTTVPGSVRMLVRQARPFLPLMFIASEPQTPSRQLRRKLSVGSTP